MRFLIKTLVDITETNARRQDDPIKFKQQQNYLTFIQTIGLRANPSNISSPIRYRSGSIKEGFGENFKGSQTIWECEFEIDYEEAVTIETLEHDFNLVPIITELEESVTFKDPIFRTRNGDRNIIFQRLD